MLDVYALKAEIVRNGMTQQQFCKKIDMAQSTFVRKMRLGIVNTDEAMRMIKVLNIKEPAKIFLKRS